MAIYDRAHNRKPPRLTEWFVKHLSWYEDREDIIDDFREEYEDRLFSQGKFIARWWYRLHALRSVLPFIGFELKWRFVMFKNYLKITLRNIKGQKVYSIINISGLVIGITCFILIFLYVRYEKSYDTFHENSDHIFRVAVQVPGKMAWGNDTYAVSPAALAPTLIDEYPEVRAATRFQPTEHLLLTNEDKSFYERGLYADEHFFDVFSFPLIKGNKKGILDNPESIIISERIALKFFGNENPIGKTLNCSLGDLEVVGIVENIPENSHIQFDWLISFMQIKTSIEAKRNSQYFWWGAINYYTYCVLKKETTREILEKKVAASMNKKYHDFGWDHMRYVYILQPLKSIHLQSQLNFEFSVNNSDKLIVLFSVIAVFVMAIACVNSMNLSSACATKRIKEISIRKVVGGQRCQLFWQFIGESLFISTLSLLLAVGLVCIFLPGFNRFVQRNLALSAVLTWPFILSMLAISVVSGLLAGTYPAVVLSSFKPVYTLKGDKRVTGKGGGFRNLLVMFQFSITIILIISSLVMFLQIRHIQQKSLGYNREHVVVMRMIDPGIRRNYNAFKNTILHSPKVVGVTTSDNPPIHVRNNWGGNYKTDEGVKIKLPTHLFWTDFNFLDFYQMEIVLGRNFSEAYGTDQKDSVIVNETFVHSLNWSNPVGKKIRIWNNKEKVVVGVVKDFHFQSMHSKIKPILIFCQPDNNYFHIRIRPDGIPEALEYLKNTYEKFRTKYPYEYFFLDDNFNKMYASEQKLKQKLVSFSGLAIFIACLGIYGLAMHTAEKRTKEIGIRKVLGASAPGIFVLLSRKFVKWVVLANIIAWPVAYYAMNKWLQNFAYRINPSVWTFFFSGLIALAIALLTVSYQSTKAATANPVDSLSYE